MAANGFQYAIKQYCLTHTIPFDIIRPYLDQFVDDQQVVCYYIAQGHAPENADTLLDLTFVIKDTFFGVSLDKDSGMVIIKKNLKELDGIMEDIGKIARFRFSFSGLLSWFFTVNKDELNEARGFTLALTKVWKSL